MMRRSLLVLAALSGWQIAQARAQTHVVKKPETVVRAVGVYEWTGDEAKPTATRLVPVTLFIEGRLEDAGVYLARPVPFTLQTGTIFELDQAGVPEGTIELSFARRLHAAGDQFDETWMGFGPYKPLPKPTLVAAKKSGPLSKIEVAGAKPSSGPKFANKSDTSSSKADDDDSGRPTMTRRTDSASTAPDTAKSSGTASTSSSDDDPDRPTMKRHTDSDTTAPASTPASSSKTASTKSGGSASSDDDAERPTLRKRTDAQRQAARKEHDSSSVTGVGSLNDDPDRPSLHRGKPAGALGEDDLPALIGLPPDLHQRIAVSDAANRSEHDFARSWTGAAERADILASMQTLARTRLAAYDGGMKSAAQPAARSKAATPPHTAIRATAKSSKPAKPSSAQQQAQLNNEVLKGYTLSYGGDPTFFYSASSPAADGTMRFVSIVAQQDPIAGLKLALSGVTDDRHLDRTPQMRLVDVVDAEASNRASLLMELRAQGSRQFALYRVIGAEAQQTFLSDSTD